jgi:CheY-like chemotaxis protein
MSYPAEIRTLIIEDESHMIVEYRRIFEYLQKTFPLLAEPSFAESYTDAEEKLRCADIYHLVILDLALPETIGTPVGAVTARGLGLIPSIGNREEYPVPVLMIVTGDPTRVANMPALEEQLRASFWKHWVISKNNKLNEQLKWGIEAAIAHTKLGIHIVGDEKSDKLWPMLSPREEDILRRAILETQSSAIGADLRWWSVNHGPAGSAHVKVRRGRLLLSGQTGHSRERFLKFVSAEEGENAKRSAELLGSKLPHGQLIRYLAVGSRALIVTEKAGLDENPPRPLDEVLTAGPSIDETSIERIASDIVDQLQKLGASSSSTVTVSETIWSSHDGPRLADAWARAGGGSADEPASLLKELRERTEMLIVKKRMGHGDLHPGNVAIGEDSGRLRAYVIDAGVMTQSVWAKDIAVLETSTILHVDFGETPSPVLSQVTLFDGTDPHGEAIDWRNIDPKALNAVRFIVNLRQRVRADCDEKTYLILLLDSLLIQIGGVAFGTTYNKIVSVADTVLLFRHLVQWYRKLWPIA